MSKIALTPNATGTGVFTISSPATNTNRTLTLPDEAGTVLTSASSITQNAGPAFSAWQDTSQTMANVVSAKILFQIEQFDTASAFTNSTFTAPVAGYYQFSAAVEMNATPSAFTLTFAHNGSLFNLAKRVAYAGGDTGVSGSCLMYLAVNDYVEVYALVTGTPNTTVGQNATFFQGILVRAA